MSGTKSKPAAAAADKPERLRIRALSPLDVDGVHVEMGAEAEIRAELVAALVACDAVEELAD